MSTPLLCVDSLAVRYGSRLALSDVGFSVAPGELIAVVGPNGAGKSTLLRAIAGLIPHSGRVVLGGTPCRRRLDRVTVAYVPQRTDLDLDFPITVGQLVRTGRRRFGWRGGADAATRREAALAALDQVGLRDAAGRSLGSLSGGQAQRALLARALAQEARLVLLDEAMSGVDQASAEALLVLFGRLRDAGTTIIVATHDLALARRRFDRCLVVNGRVVADGSPDAVLDASVLEASFGPARVAA